MDGKEDSQLMTGVSASRAASRSQQDLFYVITAPILSLNASEFAMTDFFRLLADVLFSSLTTGSQA